MESSMKMQELFKRAPQDITFQMGVVCPEDPESLKGALLAAHQNILKPILIGDKEKIKKIADTLSENISPYECVHVTDHAEAAKKAVELVHQGKIQALMKGSLHTDTFMAAIVNREQGLRTDRRMSHAMLVDVPSYHKLLIVSDVALNIEPDVSVKKAIVQNAIDLANALGIARPKVALLSSVDTPSEKVISSMQAKELCEMTVQGELFGPIQFDAAISKEAAQTKKLTTAVAGDPDILIVPNLDSGNILIKALEFCANSLCCGIVLGAKVPIVLTSRSADANSRLGSCMLAKFHVKHFQ